MTAPAVASSSQTSWSGLASTRDGTEPSGTVQGNLLVGFANTGQDGDRTITGPTGWSEIGSAVITNDGGAWRVNLAAFWIERGASAPSLTWTFSVSCFSQISIFRVTGHRKGTPIGFNTGNSGTGSTSTFTGGTTGNRDSLLIGAHHDMEDPPRSPSSGWTEEHDGVLYTQYKAITAAGATGNFTMANNSIGSEQWSTRVVEILATGALPPLRRNTIVPWRGPSRTVFGAFFRGISQPVPLRLAA